MRNLPRTGADLTIRRGRHHSVAGARRATAASLPLVFEAVERAGLRVAPLVL